MRKYVLGALCLLSLMLLISACGGSSDSSSEGASTAASEESSGESGAEEGAEEGGSEEASSEEGSGESFTFSKEASEANELITGFAALDHVPTVEELEPRVKKYEEVPKELLIDTPVEKKATAGKNIALLYCGVPVCTTFNNAMAEAAAKLNWKVTRIPLGVAPEEFTKAYEEAAQVDADMVISSGLSRELFDRQLTTLEEMNIPIIQWSAPMEPVEGKLWVTASKPQYQSSGIMLAEKVALDSNLEAEVAAFSVPQYGLIEENNNTFAEYLELICPNCSVDKQELAVADVGKAGPKITGYLQQHPDTKYVLCGFGDLCIGVAQAIKAAGIEGVKILSKDTDAPNVQNIYNGSEWASIPLPIQQTGWQVIDLAQRIFNEESTEDTAVEPQMIITKENIDDPESPTIGSVPDFKQQYEKLWKLK